MSADAVRQPEPAAAIRCGLPRFEKTRRTRTRRAAASGHGPMVISLTRNPGYVAAC